MNLLIILLSACVLIAISLLIFQLIRLNQIMATLTDILVDVQNKLSREIHVESYKAVTQPSNQPSSKPSKLIITNEGIKQAPELVHLDDLPFEEGYKVLEEFAK